MTTNINEILPGVEACLKAAEEKHPTWPKNIFEGLSIIGEEFGELQQACLQAKCEGRSSAHIETEARHLAAMALRFLKNFDPSDVTMFDQ